jgi:hypothetical protein
VCWRPVGQKEDSRDSIVGYTHEQTPPAA